MTYVKEQKGMSSFTVEWAKKENNVSRVGPIIHTSYFYCHDILDVTEKFFFNKKSEDYVVYLIKLNPIA